MASQPVPTRDARRKLALGVAFVVAAALGYTIGLPRTRVPEVSVESTLAAVAPSAPFAPAEARASTAASPPPEPSVPRVPQNLHRRDPHEWQGMRVNLDRKALCGDKSGCGMAMACIEGRCGPCRDTNDCADGEQCVLDHCVLSELVACTSRGDCDADALCILSGYSGGTTRNNERMRSYCLEGRGGREQGEGEHASAIDPPPEARVPEGPPSTIDVAGLQEEVRARMMAEGEGEGEDEDEDEDEPARERAAD